MGPGAASRGIGLAEPGALMRPRGGMHVSGAVGPPTFHVGRTVCRIPYLRLEMQHRRRSPRASAGRDGAPAGPTPQEPDRHRRAATRLAKSSPPGGGGSGSNLKPVAASVVPLGSALAEGCPTPSRPSVHRPSHGASRLLRGTTQTASGTGDTRTWSRRTDPGDSHSGTAASRWVLLAARTTDRVLNPPRRPTHVHPGPTRRAHEADPDLGLRKAQDQRPTDVDRGYC
jgi:hypothetical protein